MTRLLAAAALTLAAAGCTSPRAESPVAALPSLTAPEPEPSAAPSRATPTPAAPGSGAPDSTATQPTPEVSATPDGTATPPTAGDSPHGELLACDSDALGEIDAVIGDQLAAFAAGDWEAALGFASAAFREDFDAEALEQVITEGFPAAAAAGDHQVGECRSDDTIGEALVTLTSDAEGIVVLRYLVAREDGGWRISGAFPAGPPGQPV